MPLQIVGISLREKLGAIAIIIQVLPNIIKAQLSKIIFCPVCQKNIGADISPCPDVGSVLVTQLRIRFRQPDQGIIGIMLIPCGIDPLVKIAPVRQLPFQNLMLFVVITGTAVRRIEDTVNLDDAVPAGKQPIG